METLDVIRRRNEGDERTIYLAVFVLKTCEDMAICLPKEVSSMEFKEKKEVATAGSI